MLEPRLAASGKVRNARFAKRNIRKRRFAWWLVINLGAAERHDERGIGGQRRVHGGTQRRGSGGWHEILYLWDGASRDGAYSLVVSALSQLLSPPRNSFAKVPQLVRPADEPRAPFLRMTRFRLFTRIVGATSCRKLL